jgi:PTH1 family peptidyl-tRNA hydrolase
MAAKLILFGLGNPGARYQWTPHNLGFLVLDTFAERLRIGWHAEHQTYFRADHEAEGLRLVLIKPQTYVNRCGRALYALAQHIEFEAADLLVVVDDIALPAGHLRLRRRGSHGGHNGLRSIMDFLHTRDFPRLRMGVGPVPDDVDPADFVLEPENADGRVAMREFAREAVTCIEDVIAGGFDRAMSLYNAARPESD